MGDSSWITSTLAATDIVSAGAITTLAGAVVNVDLVDTTTTNTDMLTAAAVNAEVVDVLRTDTATELAAVPAASPDLHTMIQWVYMKIRNKETQTSSAATISNDAGSAIGTSVSSDDTTTFTKGEYA